jgi:putative nucleotidyltransferase with HDIG domain
MRRPLPLLRPAVTGLARIEPSSALGSTRGDRVTTLVVTSAIVASAVLVAVGQSVGETVAQQPGRVATLLALTLVLQLFSVRVYGRGSVSVSAIGMLASVILVDTGTAMAIAVVAALAHSIRRRAQPHKAIFDAANFALSTVVASIVFQAADSWRPGAAVLAGCIFAAVNNGLLCLAMSLAEGASWRTIWLERFHWARFHFALFGPVALAASIAYEKTGIAGLAAFALPPALMMLSVRQYLERTTAAVDEIRQANLKLRRAHRDTIAALSRSMEAKDVYTGGHTERVAALAVALARKLGFRGEELEAIEIGALLHDIGKIGIPEQILRKPAPLDESEWETVKTHPVISDYILSELDLHPIVRQCARSSHKRIDGTGYPDGLAGDQIPLPARIVLVADAFDALTSARPYRPARSTIAALAEIREHTGTQFCPSVVTALEELARTEPALVVPEPEAELHVAPHVHVA